MLWSVTVQAAGERVLTHEEIVALADVVAVARGVASGIGETAYGAQVVIEASSRDEALELGVAFFTRAAAEAGLPAWPITTLSAVSEEEDDEEGLA